MMQVQYVGPKKAWRGRTALMQQVKRSLTGGVAHMVLPGDADEIVWAIQADYPPHTRFSARGCPLGTLEDIGSSSDMVPDFGTEHPECFGWHEVEPTHWRDVHELSAAIVAL